MNPVISLRDIYVKKRLTNITLDINQGDCVHILGPNGAGKSTLLSIMAGVLAAEHGEALLLEQPLHQWPLSVLSTFRTLLAQQSEAVFAVSVKEYLSFFSSETVFELPNLLEATLEVTGFFPTPLNRLSGGERQRVEICRTLLQVWPAIKRGEAILLLDEPLQGVDIRHQYALMALFQTLCNKGNTLVLSSHDILLSANYSNTVLLMKLGTSVSFGLPESVLSVKNLEHTFDCHFAVNKRDDFLDIQVCAPIVLDQMW
ncbi:Vitamin B12-transporter ATPase [Alteromonas sp. 38]|uniref:ATP-binding cassette domain-containing protein n=1 Tax=Alteromonas TaxID=226 RepID=UPI0012EFBF1D|nr:MULTISPECIES: ATP-binding cassette domain-containing protein [Alteromonas]CAD5282273.1 Vitamin B12-transporter ATPase [Alteromonas sp. 154]VXB87888.1 Vitamin B12-transporter ATPase [Alteromonas sp. 38]